MSPALSTRTPGIAAAAVMVMAAAIVPYLPSLDDYFVRDDFGVVQLLSQKPAGYFPKWFYSSWMDFIWGYTPDEIRPFPAVSYQLTSLGGRGSPMLHHVLNILLHAANGLLVLAIARSAASLALPSSAFAALVFVLLPVQTESVAWITGRVDSMPALFYLASFLAYVRWRSGGSARWYAASLVIFFVALFTKQNTITMVATIGAYDLLVAGLRVQADRAVPAGRAGAARAAHYARACSPYLPYVGLTAGYLWLRYQLFGQVAREGALNAQALHDFAVIFVRHVAHVVVGSVEASPVLAAAAVVAVVSVWVVAGRHDALKALYFGPVWWAIGIAPVLVAGYSSPRHVYLAAVGWALALGIALDHAASVARLARTRRAIAVTAIAVLAWYGMGLVRSVREWGTIANVSHKAVLDLRSTALTVPEGSLVLAGVPRRSWEWALPYAVRPPFVRTDLDRRVFLISPRELSCCPSQWFEETRRAIEGWSAGGARDVAVALRWDPVTGDLRRAESGAMPQLPVLVRALLAVGQPDELDANLRRLLDELVH